MNKVLVISSTSIISGAEYVLFDYIKNSGYKNSFTLLHSDLKDVTNFYQKLNINCYKCKYLNPVGAERKKDIFSIIKKFFYFLFSFFCFRKIIKQNEIDIVFGNNTGDAIYSFYTKIFKKIHINCIQDIIEKNSLLNFSLKIFDPFINKYIAVSDAVKNSLIAININPSKIQVIYNGLKLKNNKLKYKKIDSEISFGFVGYIDDVKNPMEFVDFIEVLKNNSIKYQAKMVAGKIINNKLYENIIKKIKELKLNIEIINHIPREKMDLFYENINFLVITSKKEALPTVILEAFNNRTPVIGKKVGGIQEIINDNENGFLYNTKDEFNVIINKIIKLNNKKYNEMRANCIKTIKEKFNMQDKIKKLNTILFQEL
ncbi:MAG: glycosyltransferase family 4 protein [Candidatus Goldbacteria bacterium]|nr:glycosyltransferase family 4 protein [Candidatus Goldiibacteriota bacterium]